jgi:hypothetical protein
MCCSGKIEVLLIEIRRCAGKHRRDNPSAHSAGASLNTLLSPGGTLSAIAEKYSTIPNESSLIFHQKDSCYEHNTAHSTKV